MTLRLSHNHKHNPKKKIRLLVLVLMLEFTVSVYLWRTWKPDTAVGFLVKKGSEYVVAWRDVGTEQNYYYKTVSSLNEALEFANEALNLSASRNVISDAELEHIWMDERFGNYVLLWKTANIPYLHQLTFQNYHDAKYFSEAFRKGAYTPSPFGHSVLLLPIRN